MVNWPCANMRASTYNQLYFAHSVLSSIGLGTLNDACMVLGKKVKILLVYLKQKMVQRQHWRLILMPGGSETASKTWLFQLK